MYASPVSLAQWMRRKSSLLEGSILRQTSLDGIANQLFWANVGPTLFFIFKILFFLILACPECSLSNSLNDLPHVSLLDNTFIDLFRR